MSLPRENQYHYQHCCRFVKWVIFHKKNAVKVDKNFHLEKWYTTSFSRMIKLMYAVEPIEILLINTIKIVEHWHGKSIVFILNLLHIEHHIDIFMIGSVT